MFFTHSHSNGKKSSSQDQEMSIFDTAIMVIGVLLLVLVLYDPQIVPLSGHNSQQTFVSPPIGDG